MGTVTSLFSVLFTWHARFCYVYSIRERLTRNQTLKCTIEKKFNRLLLSVSDRCVHGIKLPQFVFPLFFLRIYFKIAWNHCKFVVCFQKILRMWSELVDFQKLFFTGSEGAGPQVQVLRSQLCLEQENEEIHQVDHSSSSKVVI